MHSSILPLAATNRPGLGESTEEIESPSAFLPCLGRLIDATSNTGACASRSPAVAATASTPFIAAPSVFRFGRGFDRAFESPGSYVRDLLFHCPRKRH